mgnify:CR=1 FL=1
MSPRKKNISLAALRASLISCLATLLLLIGVAPAKAADSPAPNPAWPSVACGTTGLDVAIMMDLSGSIRSSQLRQAKDGLKAMIDNLDKNHKLRFAANTFASDSPASGAPLPLTPITQADSIKQHIENWREPSGSTAWDAAFRALSSSGENYDAVLFITDGEPDSVSAAVTAANQLKAKGTRVVVVGIMDNTDLNSFVQNVTQISGPTEGSDYITTGFDSVGKTIQALIEDTCGSLRVSKTGTLNVGKNGAADETISYNYVVTNNGKVSVEAVKLTDIAVTTGDIKLDWPAGSDGKLAPGASARASVTYTVTDADRKAGKVASKAATATGQTSPQDKISVVSKDVNTDLPASKISLAFSTAAKQAKLGDVIEYKFTIKNTGDGRFPTATDNHTLYDVALNEKALGLTDVTYVWPGQAGVLKSGQTVTGTAKYTVAQADANAGAISKQAKVTANPPIGTAVSAAAAVSVPVEQVPGINLDKSGSLNQQGGNVAGDVVTYTFVATNTGNVTLFEVTISDQLPGLSEIKYEWPAEAGKLAPGESVKATATYKLTKDDLKAGKLSNAASVTGKPSALEPVSASDDHSFELKAKPADKGGKDKDKPSQLPKTGEASDLAGMAGVAALLAGLGSVVVARRKKHEMQ